MAPPWASGSLWALPLESLLGKTRHLWMESDLLVGFGCAPEFLTKENGGDFPLESS